ncbi:MAG: DUF2502 domain-containing protein [Candidatus Accumulibacter sp.]|nr:DUF2502 domain-containing protein [Accumulibacter sp.]
MKKILAAIAIAVSPLLTQAADVNINFGETRLQLPGMSVTFGSRNPQGHYWDGGTWRDPTYWRRHHGPRGERYYTGRGHPGVPFQDGRHCPPGQAKKGRCAPPHSKPHRDHHFYRDGRGNPSVRHQFDRHCPPGLAKQGRC